MTKQPFLPYSRQHVGEDDIAAVADVLRSDFLTTGPKVDEFEAAFAARVDANHAVACSSGTAALHLSTASIGLSSGDTAIVPAVTFLATANAVRFTGADVVFADIDPDTGLMTPDSAEAALRGGEASNCKSILPVHLNGQCCDIAGLKELADGKGLRVIEDACHVLGGTYQDGLSVGACQHGNLTVFSAHPVKAIAMGEGGVVTTNDDSMADRLRRLRNHGMVRDSDLFESIDQAFSNDRTPNPWYYEMAEMGFNYRASDIHCALGLSQMTKFDDFVATQNKLVDAYAERLAPLAPIVKPIARSNYGVPAWHVAVVLIDFDAAGTDRAKVMNELRARGIGTQVLYMPLYRQPYYEQRYGKSRLPGAEAYYARCLCLPLFTAMTETDVDRVVDELGSVLGLKSG